MRYNFSPVPSRRNRLGDFVGSGEPTLQMGLGWLIRQVKELTHLPIAVITNLSLLYCPEVRQALVMADDVMPSDEARNLVSAPGERRHRQTRDEEKAYNRI
jgi:hypothetical protein